MKISEKKFNQMPAELQSLFVRLPNPGSDEVVGLFPQTGKDTAHARNKNGTVNKGYVGDFGLKGQPEKISGFSDSGSAARFFYCAKASRSERNAGLEGMEERDTQRYGTIRTDRGKGYPDATPMQNHHPTVKPIELMRYLVRLTKTPTGGVVLDPFMGSGTTGMACVKEGRNFIGIELDEEYLEIAKKRIEHAQAECTQLSIDNLDEEQSACC